MSGAAWPRAEAQYQSLQKLLAEFNAHSARAPNHLLRPGSRPRGGAAARRGWRYAAAAVRRQLPGRSFNWQQLEKARWEGPSQTLSARAWVEAARGATRPV